MGKREGVLGKMVCSQRATLISIALLQTWCVFRHYWQVDKDE